MNASIKLSDASVSFPIYRYKEGASFFQKTLSLGREKHFFNALDHVTFEIKEGDRVALIGKNGSGKSTLLRVMAGILPPSDGKVEASGRIFPAVSPAPGVLVKATCAQNIILQGLGYGLKGDELKAYVNEVSQFSALGDFLNSPYESLSAGMKSRFCVSTLNYVKPEILLMDEWVGAADATVLEKNNGLLSSLVNSSKIFILASHRKDILRNHCNRGLVLRNGKLLFDGGLEDALEFSEK